MNSKIDISEVNTIDGEQFEWMFGNVIELCTDASAQVYKDKPFNDVEDLCDKFHSYLDGLSEKGKFLCLIITGHF